MYNKVPFISVIIPVYNTEKYLKRCLDSIINQTFKDIEIIIVDDCSPGYCGNCKDIAEGYKDSRIIYTRNEKNSGSAWSRINGFNYSHGKYIHFVDSDDWLADESYVKICNYLKNNYDVLYFNGIYADDEKTWEFDTRISLDYKLYGRRIAFDEMFFNDSQKRTLWCRVFKRSIVIEGIKYMPNEYTSVADDWVLNLFILFHSKNYRSVSDIFYYYYQDNPNAVTAIVDSKKDYTISFNKLNNYIRQVYISYNSVVNFLKEKKVWNIYRYSWTLYIIRDLKYIFIKVFQNFNGYFEKLYFDDEALYLKESLEYFNSNIHNLSIINFIYYNLFESSEVSEIKMFKYALTSYLYRFFKSIIMIRNYPQALFNIRVTKTNEYKRLYMRILFFKLTIKLSLREK